MKEWLKHALKKGFKSIAIDLGIVALIILGIGIYIFMNPEVATAQVYQPLAPIEGLTDNQGAPDLNTYISSIYDISIGIGVVLAILMLVISGLQYSSSIIPNVKSGARNRMLGAVLGLLLLLSSVLILQTINPELAELDVNLEPTDEVVLEGDNRTQEEIDAELLETETLEFRGEYCVYSRNPGTSLAIKIGCHESEEVCDAAKRTFRTNTGMSAWCTAS